MVLKTVKMKQCYLRDFTIVLLAVFLISGCGGRKLFQQDTQEPVLLAQNDARLRAPVKPLSADRVTEIDVQYAIEQLYEAAKPYRPPNQLMLVGLAGPQIGINMPIILVDTGIKEDGTGAGELKTYINPVIVWQSDEIVEGKEGCFSVDPRLIGLVPRSYRIWISAQDRNGQHISEELVGFSARIFQHELDHLRGVRFPDRVGAIGTLHWVDPDKIASYAKDSASWPKFSWDKWIDMKNAITSD